MSRLSPHELLTPAEVAAMFRVDAKTVTRWANNGKLRSTRTPGGHRRFMRAEVEHLLTATARRTAARATCPECSH